MASAPGRILVFDQIDGKKNARDIALVLARHVNNVRRDITALENVGLVQGRTNSSGPVTRAGLPVWEKVPLAREISSKYFQPLKKRPENSVATGASSGIRSGKKRGVGSHELAVPTATEILEIARNGEDQHYEFKADGTEVRKITREIAAMLNTKGGGILFYGIEDDGTISGSSTSRQALDQPVQNSVKNSISPAATVKLHSVSVMGSQVVVIVIPPWDKKNVYQFDEKILIRKGTNVFAAKPEEVKKLHHGDFVI